MSKDEEFMRIAIELSKRADYPYGAIVVRKDKIIGRSDAETKIKKSIFEHAQMIAIEDALKNNRNLIDTIEIIKLKLFKGNLVRHSQSLVFSRVFKFL